MKTTHDTIDVVRTRIKEVDALLAWLEREVQVPNVEKAPKLAQAAREGRNRLAEALDGLRRIQAGA